MKKWNEALFASFLFLGIVSGCSSNDDPVVAQVGNEKIHQSDVEFLRRTARQSFGEPGQEKNALNNLIEKSRLFQKAEQFLGGETGKVEAKIATYQDRFLTRAYEEFYVAQNFGHTDEELQRYFNANKKTFADSGCTSLADCREAVAQELYRVEHADSLERFIQRNLGNADESLVDIVYFESSDTSAVSAAEKKFLSGIPLDSVPGIQRASLSSGSRSGLLQNAALYESLFGKSPVEVGGVLKMANASSSLPLTLKVLSRRSSAVSKPDMKTLREKFALDYKDYMANSGDSLRRQKYKFRTEPIEYPEVKKYYEEHSSEFGGAPLDSVSSQILRKIAGGKDLPLDADYVLATIDGKPFIRERDVAAVLDEIPAEFKIRYPRARRVLMLASWKLSAMEARQVGLENSDLMKKIVQDARVAFYREAFGDSLVRSGFLVPQDSLRAVYSKFGKWLFPNAPYEKIVGYLGVFASIPENIFRYECYKSGRQPSGTAAFDSLKASVFLKSTAVFSRNWFDRFNARLAVEFPAKVLDQRYQPFEDLYSASVLVSRADSLYGARQLDAAKKTWERVVSLFPDDDSLFSRAVYEMAKIDNENEKFADADGEFAAYCAMWPNAANAEKALFSRAFLLRENLKQDSLSLELFLEFQKKYPKSELSESVDWLVKDIRSNGKLAEELLEKISKQNEISK